MIERNETRGQSERDAASALVWDSLSEIPTLIGRLAFLTSLRDPNLGRYQLPQAFHELEIEVDRALREAHEQTFSNWLSLNLEHQKADLDLHLSSLSANKRTVVETWVNLEPYRNLVPATATETERHLYLSDLEALLALFKNELGI